MASWQDLFQMLEKLSAQLNTLTELQKEKTAAVLRDDLLGVNDCMKREQVVSLTLRSMDIKRGKLYQELGLPQRPLSALPESCPPAHRPRARKLSEQVLENYQIYRSAAEVSRSTLEINLHQLEKLIGAAQTADGQGGLTMADIRA